MRYLQRGFAISLIAALLQAIAGLNTAVWAQGQPVTFSAFGDIPEGGTNDLPIFRQYVLDHNRYSPSAFILHVGDIVSTGSCPENQYSEVASIMKGFAVPAYIVVGDNDYTDCTNPAQGLIYWKKYFLNFEQNFCGAPLSEHQSGRDENFAFLWNGVLFVGINLVGGTVRDQNEWDLRMQDDATWVNQQFQAKRTQVRAAVVFAQTGNRTAVDPFTTQFRASAAAFGKPVLYIHGDLHTFKYDQPWAEKNITRLEVPVGNAEPPLEVTVTMTTNPPQSAFTVKRNPWSTQSVVNMPPCANAGPDQNLSGSSATLPGQATDDGDPSGALTTMWSQVNGPGTVTFGNANALTTTAGFSAGGTYVLRLTADDGELQKNDEVTILVNNGSINVYSLAINTVGSGNVNSSPSGSTYNDGTVVTLTATPVSGYQFSGWSGDLTGTTNPATITMNANKSVTATFTAVSPTQFTLTTSTVGSGSVSLNPAGGVYNSGTVVTLTATPASGYQFSGWSGALTGTTNPATITMNANKSVTATFTGGSASGPVVHEETQIGGSTKSSTVTTTASLTAVSGQLYLAAISTRPKLAVSSVAGLGLTWTLVKAQCSGGNATGVEVWKAQGTPSGNDAVTATLARVDSNAAIVVSRYSGVHATTPIGNIVSGNTTGSNGACSGGIDNSAYSFSLTTTAANSQAYGAVSMRTKTHTPGAGYTERAEFKQGTAGIAASLAVEDKNVATISTVNVDGTLSGAVDWAMVGLEIKPASGGTTQYTLTTNTVGSGSVSLNPTGGTYNSGTVVTLTATPASGYQFSGWSGDLSGTTNPATLTMNANKNVTATFTAVTATQYTLTTSTVGSGSVSLNPTGGTYNSGTVVTLTATPASGYQFSGWSGALTGTTNPTTLTLDANKTVTATFTTSTTDPNTNLAKGKSATASSSYSGKPPSGAVDGSTSTYWRNDGTVSSTNPVAWLRVDLGAAMPVGRAVIKWKESYYAKSYELQVSNDEVNWTKVYSTIAGNSGTQQFTFPPTTARYVRLYTTKNNKGNYQIYELEIYTGTTAAKQTAEAAAPANLPTEVVLAPNYPNPFNPTTEIVFGLPREMHVTLKVYNLTGQVVATLVEGLQGAGQHRVMFNASHLPSGYYFSVMQAGETQLVRRLMLVK